jgi:hypothetical protein
MTERLEQQYCIKFCQKLGDIQAETKEWFNHFKDGRMSADSDQHSGRPSTSWNADVIDKVRTLIMEDRRLTVWEIADEVGISVWSS